MSRMTKYLRQQAALEQLVRDPRTLAPVLDKYGEPKHKAPVVVKCRREKVLQDTWASTGNIVRTDTKYYFDETLYVDIGDRVDGRAVVGTEEYTNEAGKVEGYLVYVA